MKKQISYTTEIRDNETEIETIIIASGDAMMLPVVLAANIGISAINKTENLVKAIKCDIEETQNQIDQENSRIAKQIVEYRKNHAENND